LLDDAATRLGLGTVQFGLDYGIANRGGKVEPAEAARIVDRALDAGLRCFDTAAAYGDSEEVLGRILRHPDARIVSKLPPAGGEAVDEAAIDLLRRTVDRSLMRLRRDRLYGLLLHRPDDLNKPGGEKLARLLDDLRSSGVCAKVGVSVYERRQIEFARRHLRLDLVQAPANLLDQRLLRDDSLQRLKDDGCEVHVRSAFLQGLILASPSQLPDYFKPYRDAIERLRRAAAGAGMPMPALALGFLLSQPAIDRVIVGVTSAAELAEILAAARAPAPLPAALEKLASDDPGLVDPSRWPARA
jgi:aryl-alcohol dehydrogenase-like predicted oxidoreductase